MSIRKTKIFQTAWVYGDKVQGKLFEGGRQMQEFYRNDLRTL